MHVVAERHPVRPRPHGGRRAGQHGAVLGPGAQRVLALQRSAGNAAVARSSAIRSAFSERAVQRQFSESSEGDSSSSEGDSSSSAGGESDAGAGAGGAGAASPANCKVDVRATKITATGSLPIYHLFVIYTDPAGDEYYYRGGPGNRCGGAPPHYAIATNHGRYLPGTVDWAPGAPSTTVATGPAACGKDSCLASEVGRIDGTCTPYAPLGPNSNTVARTLLSKCGLPQKKPVWIAPGWGDPDL